MVNLNQTSQIQSALATAQNVFIVLPQNPQFDEMAAGLGLYLVLAKAGKTVEIGCPTEMTVKFSSLIGVDKVKNIFQGGKDSLTISFDYIEDAIEKVSYNIENNKFNLVIKPKTGHPPLDAEKVNYSYGSGKVDLIFTVGVKSLNDLGNLYQKNKEAFKESQIVNLDNSSQNQNYGQFNFVNPEAASISELVVSLITRLRLPTDGDIGSNLLSGIERATNRFSSVKVNSTTFEAAAFCLKIGARRKTKSFSKKGPKFQPLKPMPAKISAQKEPIEEKEKDEEKPKPDWFEPKIYKSEGRV